MAFNAALTATTPPPLYAELPTPEHLPVPVVTFPDPRFEPRNDAQGWAMTLLHIRLDTIAHLRQSINFNRAYQQNLLWRLLALRRFSDGSGAAQDLIQGVHKRYLSLCRRQMTLTLCLDNIIKRHNDAIVRDSPLFHPLTASYSSNPLQH